MTPVFADTAFYVALNSRRDALHALATEVAGRLTAPIVTTEFVLIEVANFFKRPGDRAHLPPSTGPYGQTPIPLSCPPRLSCMARVWLCSPTGRTRNGPSSIARRFTS